jgi:hypothetical protein
LINRKIESTVTGIEARDGTFSALRRWKETTFTPLASEQRVTVLFAS